MTLNKAQQQALWRVFCRSAPDSAASNNWRSAYRAFRRGVVFAFRDNCAMVKWCGMWLGIERDGYTHS